MSIFKPNIEKLKKKGNVKKIIGALAYLKDKTIRDQAIRALGDIGDIRAVEPLIGFLKDEEEQRVRLNAARSLNKIGVPFDLQRRIDLILSTQDEDINARKEAFKRIGDTLPEKEVESFLQSRHFDTRIFALRQKSCTRLLLIKHASHDLSSDVRKESLKQLTERGTSSHTSKVAIGPHSESDTLFEDEAVTLSKSSYSDVRAFSIGYLPRESIIGLCNDSESTVAIAAFDRISEDASSVELELLDSCNKSIWKQTACHKNAPAELIAKLLNKNINRSNYVIDVPEEGHYEPETDHNVIYAYDVAYGAQAPDYYIVDSPAIGHYEYDTHDIAEAKLTIDTVFVGREEVLGRLKDMNSELYNLLK